MKFSESEKPARQFLNSEGFVVRPATAMDLPDIVALDKRVWNDMETTDGTHAWRLWIDYALVFVARDNEKLLGVLLAFPAVARPDMYLLHKLFVAETAQNRGIGSALIKSMFEALDRLYHSTGVEKSKTFSVRLTVSPENSAAKKLYRRGGFCELWTEPDYYGKGKDRTIMECFEPNINWAFKL